MELGGLDGRGGVFGHAAFLSLLAHVSSTSPTLRGKFVLENVLCRIVPPPPPGVVTDLPVPEEGQTMRERLEKHQTDPSCAGCHGLIDPIGFGLENYDGIGRFRTEDNGSPIDATASIDGQSFELAKGLGALVAESPDSAKCLVRNLYRSATGHIETEGEEVALVGPGSLRGNSAFSSFLVPGFTSARTRKLARPGASSAKNGAPRWSAHCWNTRCMQSQVRRAHSSAGFGRPPQGVRSFRSISELARPMLQ